MAAASSGASTLPSHTALDAILQTPHLIGLGGSGFFAMPAVSGGSYVGSIRQVNRDNIIAGRGP
jgi:hypothetical protein